MRSSELLVYVIVFAIVILFNFLMPLLARRARRMQEQLQEQLRQQQGQAPAEPDDEDLLEESWGRSRRPQTHDSPERLEAQTVPGGHAHAPAAVQVPVSAPAPAPRRIAAANLFASRKDLRHAIVVMTVLGPCRALDPYDRG